MNAADIVLRREPLVIAHRGASRIAPENTIPAFSAALTLGADAVEFDFQESADGELVVIHDDDLIRTTNACALWGGERLRVNQRTWSELAQLDAGGWAFAKFAGTRLASVSEALTTITQQSFAVIECKSGSAAALLRILSSRQLTDRVVVQAFDWDFLSDCRTLQPDLALVALGEKHLSAERLDEAAQLGVLAIGWQDAYLNADAIAATQGRGLKAWAWTVDNWPRQQQLLAWGASGIITNAPGPLLEHLGRKRSVTH